MLLLIYQSKRNIKKTEPCYPPPLYSAFAKWTFRISRWQTKVPLHLRLWQDGTLKRHRQASTFCVPLPPILEPGGKLWYTLHCSSTCLVHNPRLALTHLVVDHSRKNFSWMLEAFQPILFQLLCGAIIIAPPGAMGLGMPSMKQLPQIAEDRYKRLLDPPKYIGLFFICQFHLTNWQNS